MTGKWSMYIMYLLSDGSVRFNELQRRMPGRNDIHHAFPAVNDAERGGLIARKEYRQIPLKVEYRLGEIGESLRMCWKYGGMNIFSIYRIKSDRISVKASDGVVQGVRCLRMTRQIAEITEKIILI